MGRQREKTVRVPSYRKHSSGQAFVEHKGKRTYLGRYGTPASLDRYKEFLARLKSTPESLPIDPSNDPPVFQLVAAYLDHCKTYYVKPNGKPHAEYTSNVEAMRCLVELYGREPCRAVGPRWLLTLQQAYIQKGYARTTINAHVGRLKRFVRWCSTRELIPPETYHGLSCVAGLRKGKSAAREPDPVRPVKWSEVAATLKYTTPIVSAMIQVQWLCGMRPGEVCAIRLADIDRSGPIWIYAPPHHKSAWRGQSLLKAIPARAQAILQPFLNRDPAAYLFSPTESERWRRDQVAAEAGENRRTKLYPSEQRRRERARASTLRKTSRCRDRYDTHAYARAIEYAIKKAHSQGEEIKHWSPNQLRHGISTEIARTLGQQKAQRWLGHADLDTTSIYTEITAEELVAIAKELDARWQQQQLREQADTGARAAV